jgi:hypothetical protein
MGTVQQSPVRANQLLISRSKPLADQRASIGDLTSGLHNFARTLILAMSGRTDKGDDHGEQEIRCEAE